MENGRNPKEKEYSSSPNASSSNSSTSSNNGGGNGALPAAEAAPLTPKSTPRAVDLNPQPTTFIHANASTFKQVVQMLTGSAETAAKHAAAANLAPAAAKSAIPPSARATCPKKPAFKLYERRSSMKNLKMISPLIPAFAGASNPNSPATAFSPGHQKKMLSPSILNMPSLFLSPVTPLISDPFARLPEPGSSEAAKAEERGIAEKGFYFHPSPRKAEPPTLLPLFPTMSPRGSSISSL